MPLLCQASVRRRTSQEERERIGELVRRRSSQGSLLGTPGFGDDLFLNPMVRHQRRRRGVEWGHRITGVGEGRHGRVVCVCVFTDAMCAFLCVCWVVHSRRSTP